MNRELLYKNYNTQVSSYVVFILKQDKEELPKHTQCPLKLSLVHVNDKNPTPTLNFISEAFCRSTKLKRYHQPSHNSTRFDYTTMHTCLHVLQKDPPSPLVLEFHQFLCVFALFLGLVAEKLCEVGQGLVISVEVVRLYKKQTETFYKKAKII